MASNGNGWKSRKLWFSVFAIGMICASGLMTIVLRFPENIFNTMVGGIITISGMFLVGNVSTKWVATKGQAAKNQRQDPGFPLAWEESSETTPLEADSYSQESQRVVRRQERLSVQRPIR